MDIGAAYAEIIGIRDKEILELKAHILKLENQVVKAEKELAAEKADVSFAKVSDLVSKMGKARKLKDLVQDEK